MCGIFGHYILGKIPKKFNKSVSCQYLFDDLRFIMQQTGERGRDSFGINIAFKNGNNITNSDFKTHDKKIIENIGEVDLYSLFNLPHKMENPIASLGNFRAEPTTERVSQKSSINIQPFYHNNIAVVHNGTIYNDKEILEGSSIVQSLRESGYKDKIVDSYAILEAAQSDLFNTIQGSYALSLMFPDGTMILARNYRDLAVRIFNYETVQVLFFASKPQYLDFLSNNHVDKTVSIPPYSRIVITPGNTPDQIIPVSLRINNDDEIGDLERGVVILSGGLDSTTCAEIACKECDTVTLMHFRYGCKAEEKEVESVKNILTHLRVKYPEKMIRLEIVDLHWLKNLGGSTLTDPNKYDEIATKDTGVETHNEWVPARNTVMMSLAAAYCDRYRFGKIYLGLNMEEGSAFPDNTTEFYELFEKVLKVGTTSRPSVINPLGNLMKHEIYKLAREIKAPIHLSWSCYHGENEHCGVCGPCTMRKIAAEMNGMEDNINYKE